VCHLFGQNIYIYTTSSPLDEKMGLEHIIECPMDPFEHPDFYSGSGGRRGSNVTQVRAGCIKNAMRLRSSYIFRATSWFLTWDIMFSRSCIHPSERPKNATFGCIRRPDRWWLCCQLCWSTAIAMKYDKCMSSDRSYNVWITHVVEVW
jgi:hypothetical protein